MQVAIIGKALAVRKLWKQIADPLKIHEEVMPQEDGTALYVFQAKFPSEKDAQMFMQLQQASAALEAELKK